MAGLPIALSLKQLSPVALFSSTFEVPDLFAALITSCVLMSPWGGGCTCTCTHPLVRGGLFVDSSSVYGIGLAQPGPTRPRPACQLVVG